MGISNKYGHAPSSSIGCPNKLKSCELNTLCGEPTKETNNPQSIKKGDSLLESGYNISIAP